MRNTSKHTRILSILAMIALTWPATTNYAIDVSAEGKKILVVMSYHVEAQMEQEIKGGIESVLKDAQIKYFYMDTKRNLAGGHVKAKEAFALFESFKPDAVIAADDNAQSMFVVPYLKDKVKTPVIFCGVNHEASKYGYPAANVTGILERKHIREGISFAQLIVPGIRKIAVILKDNPSNRITVAQIQNEKTGYTAEITDFIGVSTLAEAISAANDLEDNVDTLLVLNLTGILDHGGNSLENIEILPYLAMEFQKPTIGTATMQVSAGLLCAVARTGHEQGSVAARMVIEALSGKSVNDIPITQNRNGRRVINVTTANRLGIKLKPMVLLGTQLVK